MSFWGESQALSEASAYSDVWMHRYLQFFFNSALVVLFLYLLVQFVLTVQRDVEQRISEYSMGKQIGRCSRGKADGGLRDRHCTGNIELRGALQGEFVWL
jgi:hypothetical protein